MSHSTKIHITESFHPEVFRAMRLQSHWEVSQGPLHGLDEKAKSQIEILIIRSKTKVDTLLIRELPNLRLIISCTAGFDHIDEAVYQEFPRLTLTHTPGAHTDSAAELTWALLLACVRKLPKAQGAMQKGDWNREPLRGRQLKGKTLGIVGLGRIGQKVARLAQAFEMRLLAFDPYQEDELFERHGCQRVSYEELLLQSDIVSYHVPRSKETTKMLGPRQVELVQHGLYVINTSRGEVIAPEFIEQGLRENWLLGLGLDVHYKEPLPTETPYLKDERVVCTPHIGAQTEEALFQVSQEAFEKILQFVRGEPLQDSLPPQALWYTHPMGMA